MNQTAKILSGLWIAITIPVIATGIIIYHKVEPKTVVKTQIVKLVVTPTASPSATLVPTKLVTPTQKIFNKGGVR